jgi:ketosteroid isomerase-like protein
MSTKAVADHHLAAFLAGDLEETMRDYTEDSVMISPRGVVRGLDEIRAVFTRIYGDMFAPGTYDWTTDMEYVDGDVAYLLWHAQCANADVLMGTDTFVIRDGVIATQTIAMHVQPRGA